MHETTRLLPRPWRLLFQEQTDLASGSAIYQRLAKYAATPFRQMPLEAVDTWDVDLSSGQFSCSRHEGDDLVADVQVLGTHDGATFMWADCNPSIDQKYSIVASRTRQALDAAMPDIARQDRLTIGRRDANVLLSYGGEVSDAQLTFQAPTNNTVVYLALNNVRAASPPAKSSLLGRLRGQSNPPPVDLSSVLQMVDRQWQQHLLPADILLDLEPELVAAKNLFDAGNINECTKVIAGIKERLGPHPNDQEPGGWVLFCEALCALVNGHIQAAEQTLEDARRAVVPPEPVVSLLASARTGNWSESRLAGAYISNPARFIELASEAEQNAVHSAVQTALSGRGALTDDPLAVLSAANQARYENECQAWKVSEAARTQRTNPSELCEADRIADEQNASEYRRLLLRWFSVGRTASATSISNPPDEDPEKCEEILLEAQTDIQAIFLATYGVDYSETAKSRYRYVLERTADPLCGAQCWRVAEIWSLWDGEDIRIQ